MDGGRAIAYIRVSSVGDRELRGKFESPDIQRQAAALWCAQRGISIVDEVLDLNRSGGTLTRPGLEAAMASLRAGIADGIIVWRADRASRRTIDGLGLIDQLEQIGAWLAATDGSVDTTTRSGRMNTTVRFAMAQDELDRFREIAAVVHRRAVLEKRRHMGPAPFGYRRDDEDGRLVLDDERAIAARGEVFERRADGAGWTDIARRLDELGVRHRSGNIVTPTLIYRMVRNRVYLGEAHHGRALIMPNAHPALVDAALWAAANRAKPSVRSRPIGPRTHRESVLRGLLRCAGCRYAMKRSPEGRGTGRSRWMCRTLATERSATHECERPARLTGLEAERAERLVVDRFLSRTEGTAVEAVDAEGPDDAQRRLEEATALLDELSDLEVRRELGPKRWRKMTAEARAMLDRAEADLARQRSAVTLSHARRVELREVWPTLSVERQQEVLQSGLHAVMVMAGDAPVEERVHLVPVDAPVDLPRRAAAFVVRPWLPGSP